ncbi:tetratricopeptide repeat protein [Streptomyces sp. NPDC051555]|uniref:AfsR/SARP family transcriptional regulator n=1 Tax=Streptomyces sp. NPDC051555 TaxID=3365657 RepID=UPI0037ACBE03
MEAFVLGPISVMKAGQRIISGTSQMAALFALLATSPGLTADYGEIRHAVWPGRAAQDSTIRQAVRALRLKLDGRVISPRKHAYSILLDTGELDLLRFQDYHAQGMSEAGADRLKLLALALAEFHPDGPLHGLGGTAFEVRKSELRGLQKQTSLARLKAARDMGELAEVQRDCDDLLRRYPGWHEVFLIQLDTAQPKLSERLDRIAHWTARHGQPTAPHEREMLAELKKRRPAGPAVRGARPVLQQLPAAGGPLYGRDSVLGPIAAAVLEDRRRRCLSVVEISGMAGAGKSAVALHLAARIAGAYPDGALHADLLGFAEDTDPLPPEQLLDRFLAQLKIRTRATTPEEKTAAFRTALSGRSVLLVLDNAATAHQVAPLLPGDGTCAVIVTTRRAGICTSAAPGAHRLSLGPLAPAASQELLRRGLSPAAHERIAHQLPEIADLCDHLPLALTLVAALLGKRPPHAIAFLIAQLTTERTRLEAMEPHDPARSVRAALQSSVAGLSPEAALLLWQTAIHPGPVISWCALMDLAQAGPLADAARAIDELVDLHLLERVCDASEHYRMHDLVRVYGRHYAAQHIPGTSQDLAERTLQRSLEYALQQVSTCDRILDPTRWLPVGGPGDTTVMLPSGEDAAMRLLDTEYQTLLSMVDLAVSAGSKRHMWLLPMALITYQWRRGFHFEAHRNLEHACSAASDIASPADLAMVHRMLASSLPGPSGYERAAAHLRKAVELSVQHDDGTGSMSLAWSLHALATLCRRQGDPAGAREHSERALAIFRAAQQAEGEAAVLNGLGTLAHDRGEHDLALGLCNAALRIFRHGADRNATANALTTLAKIHLSRAEGPLALSLYEQALEIYRELDYRPNEAKFLRPYAAALLSGGHTTRAVAALERAAQLLEALGGEGVDEVLAELASLR